MALSVKAAACLVLRCRHHGKTSDDLPPPHRWLSRVAITLARPHGNSSGLLGKPLWAVADGAYAKKEFLKPAIGLGMTVVSRLRRDAALRLSDVHDDAVGRPGVDTRPGNRVHRRRTQPAEQQHENRG